jgi:hypothetical protein
MVHSAKPAAKTAMHAAMAVVRHAFLFLYLLSPVTPGIPQASLKDVLGNFFFLPQN